MMMDDMMKNVEIVTWNEVGSKVKQVNPNLYDVIAELNPSHHYPLLHISYPFGANIIQEGQLCAPTHDFSASALNDKLPKSILQNLMPVMLSLNKTSEIYLESATRIMPYKIVLPGQLFFCPDDYVTGEIPTALRLPWRIAAGTRSIFMLPKVTESISHKKLRVEFKVPFHPPKTLWEHYYIFRQIAAHAGSIDQWQSNILVFTKPWLKLIDDYFQKQIYYQNSHLHQQRLLIMRWAFLVSAISGSVKLRPYLIDTVNHLFSIWFGIIPGFQAAGKSEFSGPMRLFEQAYIDVYGLKDYLPIIMCPNIYTSGLSKAPSYYSLALPTVLESYPSAKTSPNIIHDLKDVKYLQELFQKKLGQETSFDYFHTIADKRSNICLTEGMPKKDPAILKTFGEYKLREFPAASPFVRGCIRVNIVA